MRRTLFLALFILLSAASAFGQANNFTAYKIQSGTALPSKCNAIPPSPVDVFVLRTGGVNVIKICGDSNNGWKDPVSSTGGVVTFNTRSGAVTLTLADIPSGVDAVKIGAGTVSNTKWGYLANLSSDVQTQLDAKQAGDSDLTAIAGLIPTNDDIIQRKSGAWVNRTLAQLKSDLAISSTDVSGLGTAAIKNVAASGNAAAGEVVKGDDTRLSDARTPLTHTHTASQITDFNGAADARVAAAVGVSVEAFDSDLAVIAALTPTNDDLIQRKAGVWTNRTPAQVKTDLALTKSDVGLGNVDNTSDANKPVSTTQQTALDSKANNASPAFSGTPSGPSFKANGTGGLGFFEGVNQSSNPSTPTSAGRLFWDSSNRFSWIGANGFIRTFDGTANTASRIYVLPDAPGTVGLANSTTGAVPYLSASGVFSDSPLFRVDANTLEQRNGASAQILNFYNGYTDASNNTYLRLTSDASNFTILTGKNGTGVNRGILLQSVFGASLSIGGNVVISGTPLYINGGNGFLFGTDNAGDIGASGATRPRTGFFGTSVVSPKFCYSSTVCDFAGAGSPEGVTTGGIGSTYRNMTNGDFYRKTSGAGNTGWVTP